MVDWQMMILKHTYFRWVFIASQVHRVSDIVDNRNEFSLHEYDILASKIDCSYVDHGDVILSDGWKGSTLLHNGM